jgi:DnaJ-class molecular chaperone
MGFDLYAQDAKTEEASYFRNNVWWWRPLWSYVIDMNLVTDEQAERGSYNDGYLIDREQAMRIGIKLKHLISQGHTKEYEDKRQAELDALPQEKCELCHGTGTRNDKNTQFKDMKCNACSGKGEKESFEKNYPFSVENVEQFAQFCIESGGFTIC